jgi:SOS-response transcriptional repressor LexA
MAKRKKTGPAPKPSKPSKSAPPPEEPGVPGGANEFLKNLRVRVAGRRGMKRFATLCGMPYTTYRNYEMGRNRVPFEAAKVIGEATGESPFAIVAGGESPEAPARAASPEARPREHVLHARGRVDLDSFSPKEMGRERKPVQVTADEYGKGDDFMRGGNRFVLVAKGASMRPAVLEGDLLIFARGAKPASGDVVCASFGNEWTVRRIHLDAAKKLTALLAENASFAPRIVREGKPEAKKCKVEGVLISLRRSFAKAK